MPKSATHVHTVRCLCPGDESADRAAFEGTDFAFDVSERSKSEYEAHGKVKCPNCGATEGFTTVSIFPKEG